MFTNVYCQALPFGQPDRKIFALIFHLPKMFSIESGFVAITHVLAFVPDLGVRLGPVELKVDSVDVIFP